MKKIFGATDVGMVRKSNQDAFAVETISDELAFAVLCDGMGGANGGNVASEIAYEHAREALKRDLNAGMNELSIRSVMFSAISGASALIYDAAQKDNNLAGMGTTMILAVFLRDTIYVACVGDSRVYCVSPARELQLTHDHTVVQMLVDIGEITPEDARTHPKRHFITRVVGISPDVEADFIAQELAPDDITLLCSDGFYGYLEPGELYGLLSHCLEIESAHPLIDLAKERGGHDNITAVVRGN